MDAANNQQTTGGCAPQGTVHLRCVRPGHNTPDKQALLVCPVDSCCGGAQQPLRTKRCLEAEPHRSWLSSNSCPLHTWYINIGKKHGGSNPASQPYHSSSRLAPPRAAQGRALNNNPRAQLLGWGPAPQQKQSTAKLGSNNQSRAWCMGASTRLAWWCAQYDSSFSTSARDR